jgi:hypothetical protein
MGAAMVLAMAPAVPPNMKSMKNLVYELSLPGPDVDGAPCIS